MGIEKLQVQVLLLGCKGLHSHPWLALIPMKHLVKLLLPNIITLLMPILLFFLVRKNLKFPALKLRMSDHRGEKMTVNFTTSKTLCQHIHLQFYTIKS